MAIDITPSEALNLWRSALTESVRRDGPDLSARQMAVLMTIYLADPPHTVRGLSEGLNIAKPAVTRALDRLSESDPGSGNAAPCDGQSPQTPGHLCL